jgi:hypothetical protein
MHRYRVARQSPALGYSFSPMDARHRAYIDSIGLNFIFRSTFGIVAFRLVVIREAEYRRNIFNTEATADAFVLIDPRFSGHFISTFRVICPPVRQAQMFYNSPIDYIMGLTAGSNTWAAYRLPHAS